MFGEEIEHIFCLLFWYNNERKWTIQDTVSIVKPRKDAEQYKEGELVYAKFSQKTYKAAIVRLRETKEDLTEDAKKLENLFNANLGLTPNEIMEQMGVPVTTAMQEDEGNVVQKTPATQNTKPSTNKDSKKQKKPVKSKESTENTPNAKRSKSDKDEQSENKKASNILKDEKKNQRVANLEAAKIMAKKITTNELFCQDVETTAHDQPIAPFQNSANINLETTSSVSVVRYEEPQPTNNQFNEQYSGLTPYNVPQPLNTQYQPGFTYTNMLTCMNEANSDLYGSYPGQDDNICRDPNCHVNCKSTIDALQQKIDEMQSKIQFLESQHMRGFLDKLAKKISSSDSFDVNSNTPRRPAKNIDVSKMENYTAPSSNSSISGLASPSHCGADTIRDTSNSPLLHNSQMVELVAGSGVTISTSQLNMCERKAKESGTALARLLLVVFFDAKTLSESCARGSGSSKRKMLEPSITEAIIQYCLNFKQKKVNEKEIVQAINNKCSDVRQEFTKTPKSKKISL